MGLVFVSVFGIEEMCGAGNGCVGIKEYAEDRG